jgi:hypothetical protein
MNRRNIILLLFLAVLILPACSLELFRSAPAAESPTAVLDSAPLQVEQPAQTPIPPVQTAVPTAASPTPTVLPSPTPTLSAAAALRQARQFPYSIMAGSPAPIGNFLEPNAGCNWLGVAGQVFGRDGNPVKGLIVEVSGILNEQEVGPAVAMTGSAPALGPGGYAIPIASAASASDDTLFIQVYDLNAVPQSRRISFDTYSACDRNLLLINFVEVDETVYVQFLNLMNNFYSPYEFLLLPNIQKASE